MGLTWTDPTTAAISAAELKSQSRVPHTSDDTLIGDIILAATRWCENFQNRTYINTTFTYTIDQWEFPIELPRSPVSSVTSVKYYDTSGNQQTLNANQYTVVTSREPAEIHPAYEVSWPTVRYIPETIEVIFVAGFGAATTNVPENIRQAVKLLAAHWYENRETTMAGKVSKEIELSVRSLLWQDRIVSFA